MPCFFVAWLALAQVLVGHPAIKSFRGPEVVTERVFLPSSRSEPSKKNFSRVIEDNSFFIEEAYNQERRVVQHISNVYYFSRPEKSFFFSFTQEWPVFGLKHQLSYTIPYSRLEAGADSGLNDILLNYRYQLFGHEDWAAVAPRLSVIIPTGSTQKGLGNGVIGIQSSLPVSKRLGEHLVAHANIGLTYTPNARGFDGNGTPVRRDLLSPLAGASVIILAQPNFNFLLEFLAINSAEINDQGAVERRSETILSPGFRWAINLGELQIVPGLAIPVDRTGKETRLGLFVYLSFEHPY